MKEGNSKIEFTQQELKHLEKVLKDRERKEEADYRQFTTRFRMFIAKNKGSLKELNEEFNDFLEINQDVLNKVVKGQGYEQ